MNLYLTADRIGMLSGGGSVTAHESSAMRWLDDNFQTIGRAELDASEQGQPLLGREPDPWKWDKLACRLFGDQIKLAHIYAGTFTESVRKLKANGAIVTYTAAAHDIEVSRREHERLGFSYDYPHLTDPAQRERYLGGYLAADVVICPSQHSAHVMRRFGCRNVVVISHGCDLPEKVVDPPDGPFTVGYLGAVGPDKGLFHLLTAWRRWNKPNTQLVLAGRDSTSDYVRSLILAADAMGGTTPYWSEPVKLMGWVDRVADFYNQIHVYVQPSVTEGFGIEVLEAYAHNRMVLCSTGAGACDIVPWEWRFRPADSDILVELLDRAYTNRYKRPEITQKYYNTARLFTWDKIRQRYIDLWKGLLCKTG